jgi:hypothetical protein
MALRNGRKLPSICREGLASSAGRGGIIILILKLRKSLGVRRRNGFYICIIEGSETSGLRSLKFWTGELITRLKIIGILP